MEALGSFNTRHKDYLVSVDDYMLLQMLRLSKQLERVKTATVHDLLVVSPACQTPSNFQS